MSGTEIKLIQRLYDCFNARDISGVLAELTQDVIWANAMDGGHVKGPEGVREYWTRQWAMVDPRIKPIAFTPTSNGITVEVLQTLFDLDGNPLSGQSHGLKDKTVMHIFQLEDGKVKRFDVGLGD